MDSGFEILHLSFRKRHSSDDSFGGPVDYYIGNIVFKLHDEDLKRRMQSNLEKFEKVSVATDKGLIEKYYEGLSFSFDKDSPEELEEEDGYKQEYYPVTLTNSNNLTHEQVFTMAYRYNMSPLNGFITYIEKFDVYTMREYYQDNPVVRGIIQYLQDMKDGKQNTTRNVYGEQFLSTLENLCWWWD